MRELFKKKFQIIFYFFILYKLYTVYKEKSIQNEEIINKLYN